MITHYGKVNEVSQGYSQEVAYMFKHALDFQQLTLQNVTVTRMQG